MTLAAEQGYGQIRRQTATPRSIEHKVLISLASRMEAADPSNIKGYRELCDVVVKNTELWSTFSTDLLLESNPLPEQLKAQILSLANFSINYGLKVLNEKADPAPLITINRNIAAGLAQQAASQAA